MQFLYGECTLSATAAAQNHSHIECPESRRQGFARPSGDHHQKLFRDAYNLHASYTSNRSYSFNSLRSLIPATVSDREFVFGSDHGDRGTTPQGPLAVRNSSEWHNFCTAQHRSTKCSAVSMAMIQRSANGTAAHRRTSRAFRSGSPPQQARLSRFTR